PGFVLYVLPNGIKLGLWIASEINPAPLPAGGVEITFSEASETDVRATHAQWQGKATILQPPTSMEFGFTFVALTPTATACVFSAHRQNRADCRCNWRRKRRQYLFVDPALNRACRFPRGERYLHRSPPSAEWPAAHGVRPPGRAPDRPCETDRGPDNSASRY